MQYGCRKCRTDAPDTEKDNVSGEADKKIKENKERSTAGTKNKPLTAYKFSYSTRDPHPVATPRRSG